MILRALAAAAVLVSAGDHLRLWLDGVRHVHLIGPAFLANVAGGLVIAVLLLVWASWLAPLLAAGFGFATLGAFTVATTSMGLFGDHETWQGSYVWIATAAEVVAIVAGLLAARERRPAASPRP